MCQLLNSRQTKGCKKRVIFSKRNQLSREEERLMRIIEIDIKGKGKATAMLDDRNPRIAEAIWQALPFEAKANLWGEEVYFDFPLKMENENPSPIAIAGDICFWSPGHAFCVFFGKTQPYSEVNHIGKVTERMELFKSVAAGDRIVLKKKQES
jgi:uncharacterized protein